MSHATSSTGASASTSSAAGPLSTGTTSWPNARAGRSSIRGSLRCPRSRETRHALYASGRARLKRCRPRPARTLNRPPMISASFCDKCKPRPVPSWLRVEEESSCVKPEQPRLISRCYPASRVRRPQHAPCAPLRSAGRNATVTPPDICEFDRVPTRLIMIWLNARLDRCGAGN